MFLQKKAIKCLHLCVKYKYFIDISLYRCIIKLNERSCLTYQKYKFMGQINKKIKNYVYIFLVYPLMLKYAECRRLISCLFSTDRNKIQIEKIHIIIKQLCTEI